MMATPTQPKRRYWWLALTSFVIFAIVLTPAALLEFVAGQTPNANLRFIADGGTIWAGRGRIDVTKNTTRFVIPLTWRFDPLALFRLRLGVNVEANAAELSGATHIGLGLRDIELRDTALSADARLVSAAHTAIALIAPVGRVWLRQSATERLTIGPGNGSDGDRVEGVIGLEAEQLALGGIINSPVGNHAIAIRGEGATINLSVLRSSGPLKLEGAGIVALSPPRRFTFSGFATAASDAPATLKQLGPIMPDGRQRIELNTTW